jgi:hypothetical protein
MEKMKNPAVIANTAIVILEIIGTAISFKNGINVLIWYTVQSNILAFTASLCWLIAHFSGDGKIPQWVKLIRYCAAVCLSVTFLVVVTILVPMAVPYGMVGDVLYKGPQIYHHILCPIISFISLVFLEQNSGIKKLHACIAAAPTFLYGTVMMLLNVLRVVEGPYPFLMVYEQPWFMSVIWYVLIIGIAYTIALVTGKIVRKRN